MGCTKLRSGWLPDWSCRRENSLGPKGWDVVTRIGPLHHSNCKNRWFDTQNWHVFQAFIRNPTDKSQQDSIFRHLALHCTWHKVLQAWGIHDLCLLIHLIQELQESIRDWLLSYGFIQFLFFRVLSLLPWNGTVKLCETLQKRRTSVGLMNFKRSLIDTCRMCHAVLPALILKHSVRQGDIWTFDKVPRSAT